MISNFTLSIILSSQGNFCKAFIPHQPSFYLTEVCIVFVCFVVFIVGLGGNVSLIYHLTRAPARQILPNLFLINLTIGDIIFLIFNVPYTALSFILTQWQMGEVMCKIWHLMRLLTLGVTTFTLTALSIERYLATMSSSSIFMNSPRKWFVKISLVLIWIIPVIFAIPVVLNSTVVRYLISHCIYIQFCTAFKKETRSSVKIAMVWSKFFIFFLIPAILITVFYSLMAVRLYKVDVSLDLQSNNCRTIKERRKLAKIVLGLVIVFVLCWLPEQLHSLSWFIFKYSHMGWKVSAKTLTYLYACSNPITLCVMSKRFRQLYFRSVMPFMFSNNNSVYGNFAVSLNPGIRSQTFSKEKRFSIINKNHKLIYNRSEL